ncbi:P-loop containing nucleoside triphosphate hydrolase protein [Lentithecium fluviatile CBS 122367]|uniref:P-loop containing nucleoside triphosphate hydrolase protein n=1 Tax=Lentithecium fluviatile CBS 122367 TaxID=1168545 RepID=A0A6G1IL77_9PLEO|nr:P-loop containing nucleoside triphosphate hydrolase protein [Lentithecium fluviatile CBS 122367]
MVETHSAGGTTPESTSKPAGREIGLVQGKGKGCIILLHGVPGVGKTSTAECVAAYTKRPLFPITCGDIGYEPEQVEKNLQKLFKLAHKWGCVLLIDEADVFLAERDKADVKRNGLVSVFLRILEYYSGILFLTTNRVGAFDDAFRSRIHLTLYYPKLDEEQSYQVWNMNIKRVERVSKQRVKDGFPKIKIHKDRILRFAELNYGSLQWNGRQIQNAFQTALALAQFKVRKTPDKRPEIIVEHFETIAKASIQFDFYLKEVHLGDEAKNAKMKGVRADNWSSHTVRKVQLPPGTKSKHAVVVEDEEENSADNTSESSSVESSEIERKRSRKKAKAKAKRKAKQTASDNEKVVTPRDGKLKLKSSKKAEAESSKAGERRRKDKLKKREKEVETSSETSSGSSAPDSDE